MSVVRVVPVAGVVAVLAVVRVVSVEYTFLQKISLSGLQRNFALFRVQRA